MIKMSRSFKIPETLVECFQFYTTVSNIEGDESLWKAVIQQQIQLYLNGYYSDTYLKEAVKTAGGLLHPLLAIEEQGQYADYNKGGGNPQEIAASLAVTFPKVLSTLLYLHFQLSDDYSELGGGTWKDNEKTHNTNCLLDKWLMDKDKLSKDLMDRGLSNDNFKDDSITCTKILEEVKKLIQKEEKCNFLQAQQGLFFIAPLWHDSHLGNAILFLKVFCDDVSNDQVTSHFNKYYSYVDYERFNDICTNVVDNIDALTTVLCPLFERGEALYQEKIYRENVYRYLLWLADNLSHIIRSLKSMKADSWFWTSEHLKNAKSSGPFKYGFQFIKNKKWDAAMQNTMQIAITSLTSASSSDLCQESLHDLARLITYLHTPKIQGRGVVTGLFSMAGMMTAATYAVNIMGTFDTIRSFIQFPNTVKDMVSGFYDHVKAYLKV